MKTKSISSKQLKELVGNFIDPKTGGILERPTGGYAKKEYLDERRTALLRGLLDLLLFTGFTNQYTKYYIAHKHITLKGMVEEYEKTSKKTINFNTLQSNIWHDLNKITKAFGANIITELIDYRDVDIEKYELKLAELLLKQRNKTLFSNLALKMPEAPLNNKLKQEDFEEFVTAIVPYIKSHMEYIESVISKEAVGYVKYIASSSQLNAVDMANKERIMVLLNPEMQ